MSILLTGDQTEVETSLNHFLKDTTFPYTASSTTTGMPGGSAPSGSMPTGSMPTGSKPSGNAPTQSNATTSNTGTTYKTIAAYIKSLNRKGTWIKYNSKTKQVTITSMKAFVNHCKKASKDVGAFDGLTRQETENAVFKTDNTSKLHFDTTMAHLLKINAKKYAQYSGYKTSYLSDFKADLKVRDSVGNTTAQRAKIYDPITYLTAKKSKSNVAKYWRIRTGIDQGDTALTVETNLRLAAQNNSQVKSVDFATVWNQGHTEAERTGDKDTNFIKWVNRMLK